MNVFCISAHKALGIAWDDSKGYTYICIVYGFATAVLWLYFIIILFI